MHRNGRAIRRVIHHEQGRGRKRISLTSILFVIAIVSFVSFGALYRALFASINLSENQGIDRRESSPIIKSVNTGKDHNMLHNINPIDIPEKKVMPGQSYYGIVDKNIPSPRDTLKSIYNLTKVKFSQSPTLGKHRPDADVIMSMVYGYKLEQIVIFITSLVETGYQGDIVIGTGKDPDEEMKDFFNFYAENHHLVVYELPLKCCCPRAGHPCHVLNMYEGINENIPQSSWQKLKDHRTKRLAAVIRYEYYYEWSMLYQSKSRILVSDGRDVYFQRDPFQQLPYEDMEAHIIMADSGPPPDPSKPLVPMVIEESIPDYNWIKEAYKGTSTIEDVKHLTVSCSGTTLGGQPAMVMYTSAMVHQYDYSVKILGYADNFDQAYHNVILHKHLLPYATENATKVELFESGSPMNPLIRTLGVELKFRNKKKSLQEIQELGGLWLNSSGEELFINRDGSIPAVIHQADRHPQIKIMLYRRSAMEISRWSREKAKALLQEANTLEEKLRSYQD
ncbi:hypothetical protein CTEN210_01996 [Chaetoceros tenuissimus]|uniref:Uncharacterized protein n=1 Tax=Chaetoceros tenuissimus TaxID=426638 RepID=A0AAD3CG67_9STRA|nr:hypothetical protein CTEN210_01996 [Chaetoceros tenuissimus]